MKVTFFGQTAKNLEHPPRSPDLASRDYSPFPKMETVCGWLDRNARLSCVAVPKTNLLNKVRNCELVVLKVAGEKVGDFRLGRLNIHGNENVYPSTY